MNSPEILNEKIARITDILEQIEELNKMIELHQSNSENTSMLSQYRYMRKEFIEELNTILQKFHIKVQEAA